MVKIKTVVPDIISQNDYQKTEIENLFIDSKRQCLVYIKPNAKPDSAVLISFE